MANESIKLGIDLSREKIRFIEAEEWNDRLNITCTVQELLQKPFEFAVVGDEQLVPEISSLIDKAAESFHEHASEARVCIDRRLALKKTFAVDKRLSTEAISKHIEWELEQTLIAPRDEYNVGFEHIVLPTAKNDIVVFAAVRKALVSYIDRIFKTSRLTLKALDIDLFASIRALVRAYEDKLGGVSALVDLSGSGIGYALLVDGQYAISTEKSYATASDQTTADELSAQDLAAKVNSELKGLIEYLEEELGISNLNHIYICGEKAGREIVSELQGLQLTAAVDMVEPFQNVHRQLNIESQMLMDEYAPSFLSCFGMIL